VLPHIQERKKNPLTKGPPRDICLYRSLHKCILFVLWLLGIIDHLDSLHIFVARVYFLLHAFSISKQHRYEEICSIEN